MKILVVEDDSDILQLLMYTLRSASYDVIGSQDGCEALNAVRLHNPDVIVLDLTMPGLDGFQVCEQLRASIRTAFIPIMMLTARDDAASRVKGFLVGTDDYVMKPFARDELVARLRRLLERTYGITMPRRHTPSEAPALPSGMPHESVLQ